MTFSAKTDIGQKRKLNQDSFQFKAFGDSSAWMVVCDGMGGMAAGNVASDMAVKCLTRCFEDNLSKKSSPEQIKSLLKSSILSANAAVFAKANEQKELNGMGTTVVACVIFKGVCYVAHAGDSRLYRVHNGVLNQVTIDHSIVQTMVDSGQLTEEQAKIHPNKNIITRALGVHQDIEIDFSEFQVYENDIVFLCTDGLTNCVTDESILQVLVSEEFSNSAEKLIELANNNGGIDNITFVAVKI